VNNWRSSSISWLRIREETTPLYGRSTAEPGREGKGDRPKGTREVRLPRHAGHAVALVSAVDCAEIRRICEARSRPTTEGKRYSGVDRSNGRRERQLGLYTHCGLKNLGHIVGKTTVRRIMLENGLDSAPQRRKGMPWKTFLRVHMDQIAAADFFTIEVMTLRGLIRYHVLFVMEIATRRVTLAAHHCKSQWRVDETDRAKSH